MTIAAPLRITERNEWIPCLSNNPSTNTVALGQAIKRYCTALNSKLYSLASTQDIFKANTSDHGIKPYLNNNFPMDGNLSIKTQDNKIDLLIFPPTVARSQ